MPEDTPERPALKSEDALDDGAPTPPKAKSAQVVEIETTLHALLAERGSGKTICPSEVARAIAGKDEKAWRLLMKPIRAVAVEKALAGDVVVKRKGKVIDPRDFRGVYRIGPAE